MLEGENIPTMFSHTVGCPNRLSYLHLPVLSWFTLTCQGMKQLQLDFTVQKFQLFDSWFKLDFISRNYWYFRYQCLLLLLSFFGATVEKLLVTHLLGQ